MKVLSQLLKIVLKKKILKIIDFDGKGAMTVANSRFSRELFKEVAHNKGIFLKELRKVGRR